jgi:branched-chain amino acid transport system permease protein
MDSNLFYQQLLNGLQIGLTYALIALGYNLSFGVLKIVNLAYGEIFMVTGYIAVFAAGHLHGGTTLTVAVSLAGAIIVGLAIHLAAVRPLGNVADVNSPRHLLVLVSTLGCSLVLQNLALIGFGGYPLRFPDLIRDPVPIVSSAIRPTLLLAIVISCTLLLALSVLLKYTKLGLRLRAIAQNEEAALSSGINASQDELICVALSACLAGLAALITGEVVGAISPYMGTQYGLKGLIAVIVGGLGNMTGSVLVALGLGLVEVAAVSLISSDYRDAVAFAVLLMAVFARYIFRKRD